MESLRDARRNGVILSLHPHNDRGTAVAAAELGPSCDSIIRINSQSGKGGVAYLLETG